MPEADTGGEQRPRLAGTLGQLPRLPDAVLMGDSGGESPEQYQEGGMYEES